MRKLVLPLVLAGVLVAGAPAAATGPSGSEEEGNDVRSCGSGTSVVIGFSYLGANGAELCNDGSGALPLQGRIIVTTDQDGYVTADGDRDNPGPATGYTRVDADGEVHCDDDAAGERDDRDATTLQGEGECDVG